MPPIEPARRLAALDDLVRGVVLRPADTDYEAQRELYYGCFAARPGAIVRAADDADVAAVVRFAARTGTPLALRGAGHSPAGHGTVEGGVVLDLRSLRDLEIDASTRTLWAQPGLRAIDVMRAGFDHGLTLGFGDMGAVGIAGITLGGGVGFISRRYGLTVDSLLGAELVTADGELVHADAQRHPDLFWAIRGGGGNFGVVTRLRYRMHEVATVTGGVLVLPATVDTITGFVEAADAAPEQLTTMGQVVTAPPRPFLPPHLHGKVVLMATIVDTGPRSGGERAMAPFRSLAEPLVDLLGPMPYPDLYPPRDTHADSATHIRATYLDAFDAAIARTILDRVHDADADMANVQLRVLGGAIARVPEDATAHGHRTRRLLVVMVSQQRLTRWDRAGQRAWVRGLDEALRRHGASGTTVNFLADEDPRRVREAYPDPIWDRLRAVKRAYDPDNVFRVNQNIPPA